MNKENLKNLIVSLLNREYNDNDEDVEMYDDYFGEESYMSKEDYIKEKENYDETIEELNKKIKIYEKIIGKKSKKNIELLNNNISLCNKINKIIDLDYIYYIIDDKILIKVNKEFKDIKEILNEKEIEEKIKKIKNDTNLKYKDDLKKIKKIRKYVNNLKKKIKTYYQNINDDNKIIELQKYNNELNDYYNFIVNFYKSNKKEIYLDIYSVELYSDNNVFINKFVYNLIKNKKVCCQKVNNKTTKIESEENSDDD